MDPAPRSAFVPSAPGGGNAGAATASRSARALSAASAPAAAVSAARAPAAAAAASAAAAAAAATATGVRALTLAAAHAPRPAQPAAGPAAGARAGAVVVLFRADLRVDDHAPLARAAEDAALVVPVVCFDPRHFGKTAYGFEKTGRYRAAFLLDSVRALRETLRARGADLVVRIGRPEDVVPAIARQVGAKRVFMHAETTFEEQQVEEALETALAGNASMRDGAMSRSGSGGAGAGAAVELKRFWGNTLYDVQDLPFDMASIPDVYSDFREAVETRATIRPPLKAPEQLPPLPTGLDTGKVPTLAQLNIDDAPESHLVAGTQGIAAQNQREAPASASVAATGVRSIQGGEPEALRRVRAYVEETRLAAAEQPSSSSSHANGRAGTHLGADFSCRISPWLALGCISPRRIYQELTKVTLNPETLSKSATYFELVWRDFFRFITCKYSASRVGKSAAESAATSSAWSPARATAGAMAL